MSENSNDDDENLNDENSIATSSINTQVVKRQHIELPKQKREQTSWVWTYFEKRNKMLYCKYKDNNEVRCSAKYKLNCSTSTLSYHLRHVHNLVSGLFKK
ncbi:8727_t:CDS:1, partial [Ambispora gerdemannii]